MIQKAIEIVGREIEDIKARDSMLYILNSGYAINIAEKFYPVKDERSLIMGLGYAIIWGQEYERMAVDDKPRILLNH